MTFKLEDTQRTEVDENTVHVSIVALIEAAIAYLEYQRISNPALDALLDIHNRTLDIAVFVQNPDTGETFGSRVGGSQELPGLPAVS
jgi:hypothetical protein